MVVHGRLIFWLLGCVAALVPQTTLGNIFSASITRALVPPRRDIGGRYGYTSSTVLPEIVINRQPTTSRPPVVVPQRDPANGDAGGYSYDPPGSSYLPPEEPFADEPVAPSGPSLADEYPSIDGQYLPPAADEPFVPLDPPGNAYIPPELPQRDEVSVVTTESGYRYDPPSGGTVAAPLGDEGFDPAPDGSGYRYDRPTNIYLPPSVGRSLRDEGDVPGRNPIRLQLNELACLRSGGTGVGYFRASLSIQSALDSVPLVDVESESVDTAGCEIRIDQPRLLIEIASADFARCGVRPCGTTSRELCLRVRFPVIAGMRTANDPALTLQCRIQQRIVARTHSVRLGVANDAEARTAPGTFAFGGSQRPFRSQLGLFRRQRTGGGGFTRPLPAGGAVVLGEELMLRSQVTAGDGWNFTRLSDVVMQRVSSAGTVLNTASLVTTNGCLNPLMRAIVPVAPTFDPPLGFRLGFRAAMFQGMRSGDEMVMRIRVVGCVERRECLVENCSAARSKRDTDSETVRSKVTDVDLPSDTTSIAFRIMLPGNGTDDGGDPDLPGPFRGLPGTLTVVAIGTAAIAILLALALLYMRGRTTPRPSYDQYRAD